MCGEMKSAGSVMDAIAQYTSGRREYIRCLREGNAADYLEWVGDWTALPSSARTGENSS